MPRFSRRAQRPEVAPAAESPWFRSRPETEVPRYAGLPDRSLPSNIVPMMEQFGRFEFDPRPGSVDAGDVWRTLVAPLMPFAQGDSAAFLRALADAVVPVGGWAAYGAECLVKELLSGDLDDPSYASIMTVALHFLRACGVPGIRLNGYERSFWERTTGRTEPWLSARPEPTAEAAPVTELSVGELRRIAQIEAGADSNAIFARRRQRRYEAIIDRAGSDPDAARFKQSWKTAGSLRDLYLDVGRALEVPPYWHDRELGPYFPYAKPTIPWLPGESAALELEQ